MFPRFAHAFLCIYNSFAKIKLPIFFHRRVTKMLSKLSLALMTSAVAATDTTHLGKVSTVDANMPNDLSLPRDSMVTGTTLTYLTSPFLKPSTP